MNINITVHNSRVFDFVNAKSKLETLSETCTFSEGPVWCGEGYYLFSDIPQNVIYKIQPGNRKETYHSPSGCTIDDKQLLSEQIGSNGLAFNSNGQLIICQHGNGAVALATDDVLQPLIKCKDGKRFNSPNDLAIHPDGTIFFSDPPYGLAEQKLNPEFAQPSAGIYCYRNNLLKLFCEAYQYPNGVCLSPDGNKLYTCSNKPFERFVLEYDVKTLGLIRIVAKENGDGIKCDTNGNLYLCAKEGIVIIDNDGQRLGVLQLPAIAANCCWGGSKGTDLFITARQYIFLIKDFLHI